MGLRSGEREPNGSIRGGKGKVGRAHALEEVNALVISGGGEIGMKWGGGGESGLGGVSTKGSAFLVELGGRVYIHGASGDKHDVL